MKERVYILATCRKAELLAGTLLVFRTVRTGFPTAEIVVHGNGLGEFTPAVRAACEEVGAHYLNVLPTVHDEWIEMLLQDERRPFWICDTDVIFWSAVEQWRFDTALSGLHQAEFFEQFTRTNYRERLHTCLMRLDPKRFREETQEYLSQFPKMPFHPRIDLVRQQWQPERHGDRVVNYFADTLAVAWHALGGSAFSEEQLDCFDHVSCATYADLMAPAYADTDMLAAHKMIYEEPGRARGLWRQQRAYFEKGKPCLTR